MVNVLVLGFTLDLSGLKIVLKILLVGRQESDVLGAPRHDGRVVVVATWCARLKFGDYVLRSSGLK